MSSSAQPVQPVYSSRVTPVPLLGRACTSEWLPPRLQQHHNRARDTQRLRTKLEDILVRLLPVLVLEVPHASQLLMDQGVADASHSNKIPRDHDYYGDVTRDKILLQGGGRVGELLLKEFTNPTSGASTRSEIRAAAVSTARPALFSETAARWGQ